MNGRTIAQILLFVFLVVGAIGIGVTAYNAGVTQGLVQSDAVAVAPVPVAVAPYAGWGWGWGHGFGFFGFLGGLLFLFLLIGLIRAAFGPRRGWGGGPGWYGGRYGGWRDDQGRTWEDRAREYHDEWHRAHPEAPGSTDPSGPDRPAAG
jgi:hypothetical protein